MIQYFEENDEEFRHASIDLFLGTPHHDHGLGTDAVQTMARHLIAIAATTGSTIDPAAHNERAIRCYEKVGFRPRRRDARVLARSGRRLAGRTSARPSGEGADVTVTASALDWLLDSDEPGIVFQAKRDLLGEADPPEAAHVLDGPKVRALLAEQQPDGGFGVNVYAKWGGAHWRLVSLVELGVPAGEPAASPRSRPCSRG